jgi:hypothetical protein
MSSATLRGCATLAPMYGGGEHSDAVGAEVLQKPRHRRQDGAVEVYPLKQRGPGRFTPPLLGVLVASLCAMKSDFFRI